MYKKVNTFLLKNKTFTALLISLATYFLFFGTILLNSDMSFWTSDIKSKFHPARTYLHTEINEQNRFPFWTEKVYSGFPIYADLENAYLHPYNILISVIFDPFTAYKIIHITFYLIGSLGLYLLFKRKGIGLTGFAVANLIFYFNVFITNHQIHQSMLLTLFTFPLSLYLLDAYFDTKNHKYTVFNILTITSAFYWGHPQMLILYLAGMVLYLVFQINQISFIKKFIYLLFTGWFVFLLSLPQLLPTGELITRSIRSSEFESVKAVEGAFHPIMFSTLFYSKLFLTPNDYRGFEINDDYTLTETYNYVGISVFILFLFSLIYVRDPKLIKYVLVSFTVYMMLSYSRYIPFYTLDSIPVINLFRYWNRSVVLFIFPLCYLVGFTVDKLAKHSLSTEQRSIKGIIYIIGILSLLIFYSLFKEDTEQLIENLPSYISYSKNVYEWLLIAIAVCALLIMRGLTKFKNSTLIAYLIVFIMFFDLRYNSNDMLNYRIENVNQLENVQLSDEFINERVIVAKGTIDNNETLYYDFWTVYGYSQFIEKAYLDRFIKKRIDTITGPSNSELDNTMYDFYSDLGVTNIITNEETIRLSDTELDLISNDIQGSYIKKNEGHITFKLETRSQIDIQTYIKNYPGWVVTINGEKINFSKDSLFINFKLPAGDSIVDLRFVPRVFYLGVILSLVGLSISLVILRKSNVACSTKE